MCFLLYCQSPLNMRLILLKTYYLRILLKHLQNAFNNSTSGGIFNLRGDYFKLDTIACINRRYKLSY